MNKKYLSIISMVFLFGLHTVEAGSKVTVTAEQVKNAEKNAEAMLKVPGKFIVTGINFTQLCKKGSVLSSKQTWRSNEGAICKQRNIAPLAIIHCPKYAKDFKKSYCWNNAVNALGGHESTTESIAQEILKSNPPAPTDLPPPLPNKYR